MPNQSAPLKVFIVYAHEDKMVRDNLLRHLRIQAVKGEIELWSDHEIKPGDIWDEAIRQRLTESELILLLISADFFNSEYIQRVEMQEIMQRNARGDCRLIPIIARDCDWAEHPLIGRLQALPPGGKPVVSKDWNSEDESYRAIVEGFKVAIRELRRRDPAADPIPVSEYKKNTNQKSSELKWGVSVGLVIVLVLGIWGVSWMGKKQDKLNQNSEPRLERPSLEETDWINTQKQNTLDSYDQFQQKYPSGKYLTEAETNRKTLESAFNMNIQNMEAMIQAGQLGKARKYWEAAKKIAPNHPKVQELAKKL